MIELRVEKRARVLEGWLELVSHVHLADAPGRGEPGSGRLDWMERLTWLVGAGYDGFVGLEYRPTKRTIDTLGFRELFPT